MIGVRCLAKVTYFPPSCTVIYAQPKAFTLSAETFDAPETSNTARLQALAKALFKGLDSTSDE